MSIIDWSNCDISCFIRLLILIDAWTPRMATVHHQLTNSTTLVHDYYIKPDKTIEDNVNNCLTIVVSTTGIREYRKKCYSAISNHLNTEKHCYRTNEESAALDLVTETVAYTIV